MKKPIYLLIPLLFLACGIMHPVHINGKSLDNFARYSVESSSNSTNAWFNADYSQSFNYHIEPGSKILVNFTNSADSEQMISITVGNLTRSNISDSEAAENLVLNYYEMKGDLGFLANTSWTKMEQAFNTINFDEMEIETRHRTYLGRTLETERFHFISGGQNTSLIYEQRTGLLVEASTGFSDYQISLVIDATDLIPDYEISDVSTSPISLVMLLGSIMVLMVIRRQQKFQ